MGHASIEMRTRILPLYSDTPTLYEFSHDSPDYMDNTNQYNGFMRQGSFKHVDYMLHISESDLHDFSNSIRHTPRFWNT